MELEKHMCKAGQPNYELIYRYVQNEISKPMRIELLQDCMACVPCLDELKLAQVTRQLLAGCGETHGQMKDVPFNTEPIENIIHGSGFFCRLSNPAVDAQTETSSCWASAFGATYRREGLIEIRYGIGHDNKNKRVQLREGPSYWFNKKVAGMMHWFALQSSNLPQHLQVKAGRLDERIRQYFTNQNND